MKKTNCSMHLQDQNLEFCQLKKLILITQPNNVSHNPWESLVDHMLQLQWVSLRQSRPIKPISFQGCSEFSFSFSRHAVAQAKKTKNNCLLLPMDSCFSKRTMQCEYNRFGWNLNLFHQFHILHKQLLYYLNVLWCILFF